MQPDAGPRRRQVELVAVEAHRRAAGGLERDRRDHRLEETHHVLVVGVGLVALQHRELGVVVGVDALVAEDAAELVHLVHAAHDEPLEVELGGDAQVQPPVERAVLGHERLGHGARRHGDQHGRVHFEEAALVEEAAHRRDDLAPGAHDVVHVAVRDQVQVALAVALLHVAEAVELLGGRAQRLGEHAQRLDGQGDLARLGARERPGGSDEVAEVQVVEQCIALAQRVLAEEELEAPAAVVDVDEGCLAHAAHAGDAPGDGRGRRRARVRGLGGREERDGLGGGVRAVEARGERVDAALDQAFQLGAAAPEEPFTALWHRVLPTDEGCVASA